MVNLNSILHVVADLPEALRPIDIDRLQHECNQAGTFVWQTMKKWLMVSNVSDRVKKHLNEKG